MLVLMRLKVAVDLSAIFANEIKEISIVLNLIAVVVAIIVVVVAV